MNRSLSPTDRLTAVYETTTSQLPDSGEAEGLLRLVEELETIYRENSNLADQLCEGVRLHEAVSTVELAAWTMLVSTIYNLDVTKTRS